MKKIFRIFLLFVLLSSSYVGFAQDKIVAKKPLSDRIANYNISVKLFPDEKLLKGEELLSWKNTSKDTIGELRFHLYLNAFKNNQSTFIQESGGGSLRGISMNQKDSLSWGYCKINSVRTEKGQELSANLKFIQPDDDNKKDETVAALELLEPVLPGETINLRIKFESKLPKIFARSGFADDYFLVGQWFPKIGVYEHDGMRGVKKGQWNCHQYHANSEFYADFGVYKVHITVPDEYVVGATGILENEKQEPNGQKTLTYLAEDVLDFAWTCSPHFVEVKDNWNDIEITALLQPAHKKQAQRHISALKIALDYFDKHIGKYPYKHVTIVDPSFKGSGSAGMEYPMFITAGTFWKMPKGLRFVENVIIHEFGHNYFMALLATNEFEEAWMDEGMNSYFECRIMDESYGEHNSFFDLGFYQSGTLDSKISGYNYSSMAKAAPIDLFSWKYPLGTYGMMSYNKPSVFLMTLDRLLGRETMDKIWKAYYEKWKFKHPNAKDFIDVVLEIGAKKYRKLYNADLKEFLEQGIFGTCTVDYKLAAIKNQYNSKTAGMFDKKGKMLLVRSKDAADQEFKYTSSVEILRLGEFKAPVELKIYFDNGEVIDKVWNGQERTKKFKFKSDSKIIKAEIDPNRKLVLDTNIANNSATNSPKKSGVWQLVVKFLFAVQNIFQFFSVFI